MTYRIIIELDCTHADAGIIHEAISKWTSEVGE